MWQPFGKVSGVSAFTLVSRSSGISPRFFISAARAARSNSEILRSVPTTPNWPVLYSMSASAVSSTLAAMVLPLATSASMVLIMAWLTVIAEREPTEA